MTEWMLEPCERCGRRDGMHFFNNVAEDGGVVTPLEDFCNDDEGNPLPALPSFVKRVTL